VLRRWNLCIDRWTLSQENRRTVGERGNLWADDMTPPIGTDMVVEGSLKNASVNRLVCLLRHWTWADEAMARFDRELVKGWDYDDEPMSDHPFGAYYHWCALLCAFSEAAWITPCYRRCSSSRSGRTSRPVCLASERADSVSSAFHLR
jgi:hypothetical protein